MIVVVVAIVLACGVDAPVGLERGLYLEGAEWHVSVELRPRAAAGIENQCHRHRHGSAEPKPLRLLHSLLLLARLKNWRSSKIARGPHTDFPQRDRSSLILPV